MFPFSYFPGFVIVICFFLLILAHNSEDWKFELGSIWHIQLSWLHSFAYLWSATEMARGSCLLHMFLHLPTGQPRSVHIKLDRLAILKFAFDTLELSFHSYHSPKFPCQHHHVAQYNNKTLIFIDLSGVAQTFLLKTSFLFFFQNIIHDYFF